jgi:hypothetical protein
MDAISATIVAGGRALIQLNIEVDKHILIFYINLLNLTRPFNSGLGQYMHKAAFPSGGLDSSNPCRWRGEWLHHHGGCLLGHLFFLCRFFNLKRLILPYFKVNRCYV